MTLVPIKIAWIPATVRVNDFVRIKGSFRHDAPSDLDYHGYEEMDYTICDRNGRPAEWLEKKLTPYETDQIEIAIRDWMRGDDDYYDEDDGV